MRRNGMAKISNDRQSNGKATRSIVKEMHRPERLGVAKANKKLILTKEKENEHNEEH